MERRAVSSRSNRLIQGMARRLAATRVTPDQISAFSVVASLLAPLGLLAVGGPAGAVLAIAGIQLRLLANVLDGLVAVEGGKGSALGALYNEFPDRLADSIILVSIGHAAHSIELGWLCALLAALTAYVRVAGGALGQPQRFLGPMAKQHRMAVATVALALAACAPLAPSFPLDPAALRVGLIVIAVGSAWTCWTRTRAIAIGLAKPEAS
ncbi:CDP-alcohol phosphatidyltransferase [Bordetella ansorpii]|uniref:CDP-alcohol phosphatidyltransferase n=1 Tax=Bordetella ansorpii TaxID=288768 RepID=A0A157QAD3_9BORD|nr:CDP-alcohol phosphatidyltransferase [Bordetella ansorpii]